MWRLWTWPWMGCRYRMRSSFHFQGLTAFQSHSQLQVVCGSVQLTKMADFSSRFTEGQEITILSPTSSQDASFINPTTLNSSAQQNLKPAFELFAASRTTSNTCALRWTEHRAPMNGGGKVLHRGRTQQQVPPCRWGFKPKVKLTYFRGLWQDRYHAIWTTVSGFSCTLCATGTWTVFQSAWVLSVHPGARKSRVFILLEEVLCTWQQSSSSDPTGHVAVFKSWKGKMLLWRTLGLCGGVPFIWTRVCTQNQR